MSLDLAPSFKTFIDARVQGLVSNVDYLENWHHNFIQKKYDRKICLLCTHISFSGLYFFFLTPEGKNGINKALSKQFLLIFYFWFKVLSFKTQFKIEF